jgi:hypothetical protein
MGRFSAVTSLAILSFVFTCTTFGADRWAEGVVVSAQSQLKGGSLDYRAIYACARSMKHVMFPRTERIRVFANPTETNVLGDVSDDTLPGFQMAVILKATNADTGKALGTAECDVTPRAEVVSLTPGTKDLSPDSGHVMIE